tara:strand:+ start:123 stop:431 length:309 start_codon:yes stop_codon:yes gene_type:complete
MKISNIDINIDEYISFPDCCLIDVRSYEETKKEPLQAKCVSIPMDVLLNDISLIDINIVSVFICAAGIRSKYVAEIFRSQGYQNVYSLKQGVAELNHRLSSK